MDDGSLISALFDLIDEAYILLDEGQSDGPLHSGIRKQWIEDRRDWINAASNICSTYLEGWTPPK